MDFKTILSYLKVLENKKNNQDMQLTLKKPLKVNYQEREKTDVIDITYYVPARDYNGQVPTRDYKGVQLIITYLGHQCSLKTKYVIQDYYIHKVESRGRILLTIYKTKHLKTGEEQIIEDQEFRREVRKSKQDSFMENLKESSEERYIKKYL